MSTTRTTSAHTSANHGLFATLCGPAAAAFAESVLFYPAEVVARRMAANKQPLFNSAAGFRGFFSNAARVAMGGTQSVSPLGVVKSLYSGFRVAAGYRMLQRGYKYGGQPIIRQILEQALGSFYNDKFGQRWGRVMLDGTAGALVGVFEAPLMLPLDAVKVRLQVNRASVQGGGFTAVAKFMAAEGWNLYRGMSWTIGRNAIGSTSFFTSYAMTREYLLDRQIASPLTTPQKLLASTIATMVSITLTHPLDVIKTRLQSGYEARDVTGLRVAAAMIQHEGLFSVWKGYLVKIPTAGPRVIFSYALAQTLTEALAEWARPALCSRSDQIESNKPSLN